MAYTATAVVIDDHHGHRSPSFGMETTTMMDEEGVEFTTLNKARLARRLRDRWRCQIDGHSYCFRDAESIHIQLSEDDLEKWVLAIHDGLGTILAPPDALIPHDTDSNFVGWTPSGHIISYQRPFRFQLNPMLTDLRSWHRTLSSSSMSSGVPGPGYLSGKAIKWVGEKILDAVTPLAIRRRMWMTGRLLKRMEKQPVEDRWNWLLKSGRLFYRTLDDILELSASDYEPKYQALAVEHSQTIKLCWRLARPESQGRDSIIEMKITLLRILYGGDTSVNSFGASLREIILQETVDTSSIESMIAELLACAFNELYYGLSSKSRADAYLFVRRLYLVPAARQQMERLSPLLETLARKVYNIGIEDHVEYATAVRLFVLHAHDHHTLRQDVLRPKGLGLVSRLKVLHLPNDSESISALCWTLENAAGLKWVCSSLLDSDTCEVLLQLLIALHSSNIKLSETAYDVVSTLHHLSVSDRELGLQVVNDSMTPEASNAMKNLMEVDWGASWMTRSAHSKIHYILKYDI